MLKKGLSRLCGFMILAFTFCHQPVNAGNDNFGLNTGDKSRAGLDQLAYLDKSTFAFNASNSAANEQDAAATRDMSHQVDAAYNSFRIAISHGQHKDETAAANGFDKFIGRVIHSFNTVVDAVKQYLED